MKQKIWTGIAAVWVVGASLWLSSWMLVSPKSATRALKDSGYTNITITGWRPFAGWGELFSTGFEATGPTGRKVTGTVTKGIMKGSTVRLD